MIEKTFTFYRETPVADIIRDTMVPNEHALVSYKTFRDTATFTTKRLIIADKQGIRGNKIKIYSIPYKSITEWSIKSAGTLDMTAEVTIQTRNTMIKIHTRPDVDIHYINQLIADVVL